MNPGEFRNDELELTEVVSSGRTRVLLVEDSPDFAALVRQVLETSGIARFDVDHVERLDYAMAQLAAEPYDAVLLDLSLPDAKGHRTIEMACTFAETLPIVVLTGNDDEQLALEAIEDGVEDYLVKSQVHRRTLPGRIQRAIARHRRSRRG